MESATSGAVTAELSYIKRDRGRGEFRFEEFRDFRVRVLRGGVVLYDKPVGRPCEEFCTPAESALTGKHIGLRDLNGDGEPEAIVGLLTCGACGSRPIRIWHYGLSRFEVATPSFPAKVRAHARRTAAGPASGWCAWPCAAGSSTGAGRSTSRRSGPPT